MPLHAHVLRCVCALLALAVLALAGGRAVAAGAPEGRAFTNALKSVEGGWWDVADKELGAFLEKYPKSEHRPEAVLYQAQARCKLDHPAAAVQLLAANLPQAGSLTNEYQFWLGEAHFLGSNYLAAAQAYGYVAQQVPALERRLQAVYGQARSLARLGDWPRVTGLLAAPEGLLQQATRTNPASAWTADGLLLLAQAQLELRNYPAAKAALRPIATLALGARSAWLRQYLACRADLGEGRIHEALAGASNLVVLAAAAVPNDLIYESRDFTASLLAELNRTGDALGLLAQNLATNAPAGVRQAALFQAVKLLLDNGRLEEAGRRFETFLSQFPQDVARPAILLSLGELNLRQHLARGATNAGTAPLATNGGATNLLPTALGQFAAVLTNQVATELRGRVHWLSGWALWYSGRIADSRAAFELAAQLLPFSEAQAVARFKVADAAFQLGDFKSALTNYTLVIDTYTNLPAVAAHLLEPALYQQLRTGLQLNERSLATRTLERLLASYPATAQAPGGMLLLGQRHLQDGDPAAARAVFAECLRQFPDAPVRPETELAIARSWEQAGQWDQALGLYASWITNRPAHPLRPVAEYGRAWASDQAGQPTNAYALFTNLVAQFPTNALAPLAQNWIADFYLRNGDFKAAEKSYQLLSQKWPDSALAPPARMMAGRTALGRLGFGDALDYFTLIINDTNSPPALVAEALLKYGDATAMGPVTETNKPLANFEEAIRAFSKLLQIYPTNALAPLAQGRVGDCYLQLATLDPKYYDSATQAYQKVLDDPRAAVTARSQAEVGLGLAFEKLGRLKANNEGAEARRLALEHYLNVVYEKNLRDGESAVAFWVHKAGLEAARLAEDLQQWPQAASLYEHLARVLPALQPGLESRLAKIRERLAGTAR